MLKTQNYNLNKPELTDPVRVDDFNENAEIIDAALNGLHTEAVTLAAQVRAEAANALAAYKTTNDAAVAGKAEQSALAAYKTANDAALAAKAEQSALDAYKTSNDAAVAACGNCKIAVGSYEGSGTYGADNPTTLTFDFAPKMVAIWTDRYKVTSTGSTVSRVGYWGTTFAILLPFVEWMYVTPGNSDYTATHLSFSDKSVECYSSSAANSQWNSVNTTYFYLAIG